MNKTSKRELKTIEEYSQYYSHIYHCSNCGAINIRYIKKGVRINEVYFDCEKCGRSMFTTKNLIQKGKHT